MNDLASKMDLKNKSLPYSLFASYYDTLMDHVNYHKWYSFIRGLWIQFGAKKNRPANGNKPEKDIDVLEIGCGTGSLTLPFYRAGFNILGMDSSMAMLAGCKRKGYKGHLICADMKNFCLNWKFNYIFSVHDTVNYLISLAEVREYLGNVSRHLQKGALFLFDITTEYNILENFHESVEHFHIGQMHILWSNIYDQDEKIITSNLRFDNKESGKTISSEEVHIQKIYEIPEIKKVIMTTGFEIVGIYGDQTLDKPGSRTTMVNFLLRWNQ
jgi:SAM-dependent methyltransferase